MWYRVFIDVDMKELYYCAQASCYFHAVCFWGQKYILQCSPFPNKKGFCSNNPKHIFPPEPHVLRKEKKKRRKRKLFFKCLENLK